jgi:hypothetical protein
MTYEDIATKLYTRAESESAPRRQVGPGRRALPLIFRSCVPISGDSICDVDDVREFLGVPVSAAILPNVFFRNRAGTGSPGSALLYDRRTCSARAARSLELANATQAFIRISSSS